MASFGEFVTLIVAPPAKNCRAHPSCPWIQRSPCDLRGPFLWRLLRRPPPPMPRSETHLQSVTCGKMLLWGFIEADVLVFSIGFMAIGNTTAGRNGGCGLFVPRHQIVGCTRLPNLRDKPPLSRADAERDHVTRFGLLCPCCPCG